MQTEIESATSEFPARTAPPWAQLGSPDPALMAFSGSKRRILRPTVAYLRAMREADLAVVNFARKYRRERVVRSFTTSLN